MVTLINLKSLVLCSNTIKNKIKYYIKKYTTKTTNKNVINFKLQI